MYFVRAFGSAHARARTRAFGREDISLFLSSSLPFSLLSHLRTRRCLRRKTPSSSSFRSRRSRGNGQCNRPHDNSPLNTAGENGGSSVTTHTIPPRSLVIAVHPKRFLVKNVAHDVERKAREESFPICVGVLPPRCPFPSQQRVASSSLSRLSLCLLSNLVAARKNLSGGTPSGADLLS